MGSLAMVQKVDDWLVVFYHPSEKYEFVNWDDEQPNINGKIKNGNQTTNQEKNGKTIF